MTTTETNSFNWNKFAPTFMKWDKPGVSVRGTVTEIRIGNYKGDEYPEVVLATADGPRTISASQVVLKGLLVTEEPSIGDELLVEYLGDEADPQPGMNPRKLFKVAVKRKTETSLRENGSLPPRDPRWDTNDEDRF
jgi:hypothetical protein